MLNNEVISAWQERQLPAVLASVNQAGEPNIIYVSSVSLYKNQCFLVADNYFCKTKENILAGCKTLSLLFINKDMQAYQIKAEYEYHSSGPYYEDMKSWNPTRFPGHAVLVLRPKAVFKGAQQLC